MTWYEIFYKPINKKDMKDENPYNLPTYSEKESREVNLTGIRANDGGGLGVGNYKAYFNRADVQKSERALENLVISLGLKKPDANSL